MGEPEQMSKWENDKKWSDKFLPEIKRHLGEFLIEEPKDFEEDRKNNTDLVVLELRAVRIACRIRKDKYREKYGDEFTVRERRNSGNKTELAKIVEGWGNFIFYGFADERHLTQWLIGDLNAFRLWFNYELVRNKGVIPGIPQTNFDGSSDFRAFKKNIIPNFIVAESGEKPCDLDARRTA